MNTIQPTKHMIVYGDITGLKVLATTYKALLGLRPSYLKVRSAIITSLTIEQHLLQILICKKAKINNCPYTCLFCCDSPPCEFVCLRRSRRLSHSWLSTNYEIIQEGFPMQATRQHCTKWFTKLLAQIIRDCGLYYCVYMPINWILLSNLASFYVSC